jgi:hypothetical protein
MLVSAPDPAGRQQIYNDLTRLGERIIDFQFRLALDALERNDRLIGLGVAMLAGMVAIMGFILVQGFEVPTFSAGLLGVSILIALYAEYRLVRLNSNVHRQSLLYLGPDVGDTLRIVELEQLDRISFRQLVALSLPNQISQNREAITRISNRLAAASRLLASAAISFLLGLLFIAGNHIHG